MDGACGLARGSGVSANGDVHIAAAHALHSGLEFAFSAGLAVAPAIEEQDAFARLQAQHLHMARGLLGQADQSPANECHVGIKTGAHGVDTA